MSEKHSMIFSEREYRLQRFGNDARHLVSALQMALQAALCKAAQVKAVLEVAMKFKDTP